MRIEGVRVVEIPSGDTNNGTFTALAKPFADMLAFEDEKSYGQCRVRMQRIGARLLVEDNGGGAGVSFLGFYRRKR